MSLSKRKSITYKFKNAQFSHCLLVWMFHSIQLSNKTNNLHKRCLRIVRKRCLAKDGSVLNHHKGLPMLAVKMFKGVSSQLITEFSSFKDSISYNFLDVTGRY